MIFENQQLQMGIKTIGLDINESQLEMAKKCGADAVFNSMTNKDYVAEILKLTGKGCHAAAVYSASNAAYAGAPNVLKTGGLLMVIGIAPKGLDFINTFDLTTGRYRIKADSTGIPQRMRKAVDFTGKHRYVELYEARRGQSTLTCKIVYSQKLSFVRLMTCHKWLLIWRLERQTRGRSLCFRCPASELHPGICGRLIVAHFPYLDLEYCFWRRYESNREANLGRVTACAIN
jgi:hypothetical protein